MTSHIHIGLSSPPDRQRLVADLMLEHEQLAEVHREGETLAIEIYPRRDGEPWRIDLSDLQRALAMAQSRLIGEGPEPEL